MKITEAQIRTTVQTAVELHEQGYGVESVYARQEDEDLILEVSYFDDYSGDSRGITRKYRIRPDGKNTRYRRKQIR